MEDLVIVELCVVVGSQFLAVARSSRETASGDRPVSTQVQAVGRGACPAHASELGIDDGARVDEKSTASPSVSSASCIAIATVTAVGSPLFQRHVSDRDISPGTIGAFNRGAQRPGPESLWLLTSKSAALAEGLAKIAINNARRAVRFFITCSGISVHRGTPNPPSSHSCDVPLGDLQRFNKSRWKPPPSRFPSTRPSAPRMSYIVASRLVR
ncbi:hypothetical protein RISK_000872 [Rhodopirellula islandica]|uniref:Uncharacterized protein n=1 Tax=Rhodopirellula islandica TaxID=595434 RepID=A0A0J1BKL0_RHOIS|nr:hypothetical protein RISK_000872 [Rhodopirellula islandica]